MASTLGGWYLNGTTLQLRAYKEGTTELSTTVLASITGLTGLKMENGVVKVNRGGGVWSQINKDENGIDLADPDITVEETAAVAANPEADPPVSAVPGTINFKIGKSILGSSNISVSGSNDYKAYMNFIDESQKVHIDGTETITYNSSAGTATIIADLTAGFTLNKLDGTATSATHNSGKTNQTLATISGLQKNYTASTEPNAVSTVAFKETTKDNTSGKATEAGYLTLSKVSDTENADATTVSALGTGAITLTNQSIATNNGINYYLKLGGIPGDYVQKNTTDEAAYWTVKGTTATYQYYSPTGYQLTDSSNKIIDNTAADYSTNQTKATKIKVTAAKTTTVVTVNGLAQNLTTNATDEKIAKAKASVANTRTESIADQVGSGQARTGDSASAAFVSGITVTSGPSADSNKPIYKTGTTTVDTTAANGGKGTVEINITKAALPTSGTVTVTPGSAFTATVTTGNDFYKKSDADLTSNNPVKKKRIWVINGNTAIYKEVDLAYYEVQATTANGVTKIVCTAQTGGTVLATIRGLNEDWLANEANLTRSDEITTAGTKSYELDNSKKDTGKVITAIKGITFTKEAGYDHDNNGKPKAKTSEVGEITLSKEVLGETNVTIGGSENFKLALLATTDSSAGTTAVPLPTFSNYKWNLNNTTATLKGDITAGYWAADNGKTINYTATAKNQTLASVSGLKSGTQLNSSSGDTRTIGNYTSTSVSGEYENFESGVTINATKVLEHKTTAGEKTLTRMPITISKHVLGTSQVNLTSNFFTLALDRTIADGADLKTKDASPTYVFKKSDLYDTTTDSSTGKTTDTPKPDAGAIVGWHGSLGSTSTLKQSTPAYYTLGDPDTAGTIKKITYTKPGTATTVATVKGLNSAITENDIAFDTKNHVITIKTANALTTSNVTIEMPKATTDNPTPTQYTLALESGVTALGEAKLSDKTWKQNGTTLSYTAKVTGAGYKLNNDKNIITYTKEATSTPTTLATITGIRAGLVTDTTGVTDPSTDNETKFSDIPGVIFDPKAGTVTLTKAALNSANVKLSGNGNYKLLINTDSSGNAITSGSENYIVTEEPAANKIWVISGSTATYRLVTPEYYIYDPTANSLTYVKPANAKYQNTNENNTETYDKTKTGDIPAIGQIKGLKSNLVVSADGQKIGYYNNNGAFQEAITVGTKDTSTGETAITIKDDYVLDYKNNVTLDNAAINNGYKIYLDTTVADGQTESLAENIKPALDSEVATPAWTVSNGTATYKGTTKSGYANSSDGKSIIFTQGKSNVEIAKITGLKKTGLTSINGTNDLVFGTGDDANVITVYGNVLTNSDVNLTTSIAVLGKDYKLAIDSDSVSEKADVDANGSKKIWTVSGTTATYGTYKEDYYSLNNATGEASNKITYHAAGVAEEDQLAVVTGLASGLIASKVGNEDDQIRGITVTSQAAVVADSSADPPVEAKDAKYEILLSSTVLPTSPTATGNNPTVIKLENKNSAAYKLAIDSSVVTPEDANLYEAKNQSNGQTADLTITNITTAGYTLDADKKTLTYSAQATEGKGLIAKITGLKPNLTKNANGSIEGIAVDKTKHTITLTKAVLTNSNVELPENENPENSQYTLKLASTDDNYTADQVPTAATSGYGWKKDATTKGKFELRSGMALFGYTLESGGKKIKYTSGDDDGSAVATITGLDKATLTGTEIGGITVSEATESGKKTITITVSTDALSGKDIVITPSDTSNTYKLALNGVEASKTTSTWSVNKGTATYKQEFSEGYALDTTDTTNHKIKYTPKGTITSTLTGLSQENLKVTALEKDTSGNEANKLYSSVVTTTETPEGATEAITTDTYYGIEFNNGVFTVTDSDALAHKNVALTTSVSSGLKKDDYDYKLALGNDKDLKVGTTTTPVSIKATVKDPVWVKSNTTTTATYTQETASGYSLSGDKKSITYSTDPKFVNLATVSNLKKDVELNSDGKIVTTAADGTKSTAITASIKKVTDPSDNGSGTTTDGTIKVAKDLFDGKNVTLKNTDKYVFTDDSVENEPTATQIWTISGSTATYKNVTPAYYSFTQANGADNKRSIKYNAQADYKGEDGTTAAELTKITGLKSVKLDSEGYVLDASGNKIQGLSVSGESVALSAAVLGTSNITSTAYTLSLTDNVTRAATDVTEWVGNGTTYNYKKYNKAYYTLDPNGNQKVTYTAAKDKETYATITGLAKDLVDNGKDATEDSTSTAIGFSGNVSNGGTITLGATQLAGVTGTVKLTSTNGKFKLALNTDTASGGVTESKITPADAWTTSGTTATLKGFKSAGFTLNDSGDTITYQKEGTKGDGKQTEVTVATVKGLKSGATIAKSDVTDGTDDDAGTKIITLKLAQLGTSNVTLTGDGYKLALAADATSANDEPKWVKATNTTKATYSQNNYNGFTVSADGKTLNYWKSKNNNVDLATINGLAKDVTEDQMGVTTTTGETTLTDKLVVINTADKTITIKKEALGSNNVTLNKNDNYTLQLADVTKVGGKEITNQIVYDKNAGKASIVSGTTEYWEQQTDGKTLKYTAAKFTTKAEITGLPKTLAYTEADGTNAATLAGISVSGDEITVSSAAVAGFVNNNAITLSNKTYKDDNGANQTAAYKLKLDTGLTGVPSSPDKKEWTLSGTTLTLKELTSAGYTLSNDSTKLTYSAAKTGNELAKLTFSGLANGTITKQADGNIYVGNTTDDSLLAVDNSLTSADSKEITIKSALIRAINNANVATTINLASSKGYSLSSANFTSETSAKPKDPTINQDSFSKTATNGTVTVQRTADAGWTYDDKKATFTKAASSVAGTISGINKAFTWTTYNGGSTDGLKFTLPDTGATVGTITVGADALTTSNVTFSKVNGGNDYTLVLDSTVAEDDDWKNTTDWVNNNGTANYKTYDDEHWYKESNKNQITYVKPSGGKSYAQISGMSKTASIVAADVTDDGVITLHKEDLGTSKVTLSITKVSSVSNADLDAEITAGNTKASAFKLALDSDVTLLSSVESAVWDNNGTVATLTGTIKKGYKLSNDQKSVTYQSADKKLQQIAKVSGIKKDSQILDKNVTTDTSNAALPNLKKITLTNEHLGTSNVQLTGEGYKLALSDDVLVSTFTTDTDGDGNTTTVEDKSAWENKTEWVNNNGTFTYKTYDKIHYKLNDAGTQVQYIAAKDDNSNPEHKTFAKITGLAKDALPSVISAITDTLNNNTVADDGVISLTSDLLNKANIQLTDNQTSGYTLNMENVDDSLKSTVSNFNASVSGTGTNIKADWVGTQGKGYFLNNDMQNITYYSAAKTNQTIAKVTGLASTVTSDNNDAFSAAYTADTNVVSLGAASLGSSVTVSGTAAFDLGDTNYKDAQIVGSGSADKLTVSGSNLSINAGGGNDIVDLTNASGSTFLYANGNGNDIITNFGIDNTNTIKITNVAKVTTDKDGKVTKTNITVQTDTKNTADTIVKVNNGTIRVKGVISGVKVFDKDGEEVSYTSLSPANVLADDNYAMTPQNTSADEDYAMSPNLSSIVKGATSSYTADDLATDDATSLTKQSTAVSFSGKK